MYRIAVIQNESEMLRSGFTNVIPKLQSIRKMSQYSFELFNIVNLQKLFQKGDSHLGHYDSLIITTNATSETVLAILRNNKADIEEFISNGKGIFIASQKKISTSNYDSKKDNGKTLFLPDLYEYYTVERPKVEKDSGIGEISIATEDQHILLQYPAEVTAEMTQFHCENNEFKKHVYRSHIVPQRSGSFVPIFIDTSYENISSRNLIMVNLVPQNGERIVISTIAIDWEFHENLLLNIITYITEGLPKVAFIDNASIRHGDFDFLLTSAKLSKIAHKVYGHPENIKKELLNIHNTYIFSPDWNETDIGSFIRSLIEQLPNRNYGSKSYVRVYYFKQIENILTLTQYSNFSTIDLITDSAVLWVNSLFPGRMWNNSFWTTHDILFMFHDLGVNIQTYVAPILKDIKHHYLDYSYDGVTGATCGLLELLFLFERLCPEELEREGIGRHDFHEMVNWLIDKFNSQSIYDKQTVVMTFEKYHQRLLNSEGFDVNRYAEMRSNVCSNLPSAAGDRSEPSETDLCRKIGIFMLCDNRTADIVELVSLLKRLQTPAGKWTNTGRTAHVLVFLLNGLSALLEICGSEAGIDEMIYNGVLFLRSEYDWRKANWNDEIQSTAKALQAIGLYNIHYKYSTQDFFKTLEIESDKIYSATVIHNVSESMRKLRQQTNEMILTIEQQSEHVRAITQELERQKETIESNDQYEHEIARQLLRSRTAAIVSSSLLVTFVFYLALLYPDRVLQEIRTVDLKGIILGFVVALLLTNAAQRILGKNEVLKNYRAKKKKRIK